LARLLEPVLPALLLASVPAEVALGLQLRAELRIQVEQGPGGAQSDRARLAGDAAAPDRDDHVEVLLASDQAERRDRDHAMHARREVVVQRPAVDVEVPGSRDEPYARHGFLAAS